MKDGLNSLTSIGLPGFYIGFFEHFLATLPVLDVLACSCMFLHVLHVLNHFDGQMLGIASALQADHREVLLHMFM